jgi:hypothetical protein
MWALGYFGASSATGHIDRSCFHMAGNYYINKGESMYDEFLKKENEVRERFYTC